MAEEQPSLHIDTDWKKQAQEEKRRLAEDEQKRAAEKEAKASAPATIPAGASTGPGRGRPGPPGMRGERAMPQASFSTLVNSLLTQIFLYLGDLTPRGAEPQVNLDMARFNVDLLGVLEEKTKGNLTPDEQKLLDNALYEARTRFVNVASQYATV